MFNNLELFLAPVKKIAELNKAQMEKAFTAQQEVAKEYIALTEARFKAAASIKDIDGLNAFVKDQAELAKSGFEKVVADSKAVFEDVKAYNEEVIKVAQESNKVVAKEVKTVTKTVAKKAA